MAPNLFITERLNLHQSSHLYQTPSKFYIQPIDESKEALIIDRQTCEITVNKMFSKDFLPINVASCIIDGVIGIKRLLSGLYLIVITNSIPVGTINGEPIYRVEKTRIIPFSENQFENGSNQHQWETTYIAMLESVLRTPSFYFSYGYDLTNSLQRNHNLANLASESRTNIVAHLNYDKRFLWNQHLMVDFDRCGKITDRYRLPFIHGFVAIKEQCLPQYFNWSIISRRGTKRAGTRFNSRGADYEGSVSNFVETEQIIEGGTKHTASFVQIRGSIPLLWGQTVNYRMKPPIEINTQDENCLPLKNHLEELRKFYGNVSFVSLIDQRGHEGQIAHEYSQKMSSIQQYYSVPYHHFDFHKECGKMRWHRLKILIDRIRPEIEAHGYFYFAAGKVMSKQTGVMRSNCIDSLDRTNVVQSMIAHLVLESQMDQISKLDFVSMSLDDRFLQVFKNTWADNADALSVQYAGTPALKTDFTRTGQRTHSGAVMDGINSLTRYFANNFFDDYRQDAIDLFLGNYEGYPSPLYKPLAIISYASLVPVAFILFTLVALYLYMRQ